MLTFWYLFFSLSNTLLCLALALSLLGILRIIFLILLKVLPCSGFVKKSPSMFVVGQKTTWLHLSYLVFYEKILYVYVFSLNLKIFCFLPVVLYSCCLGILSLLVQDILVQQRNVWSTGLVPSHHKRPTILTFGILFLFAWSCIWGPFS